MIVSLNARTIKVATPVRDQAVAILRDAIQAGDLLPGTPLIERELSLSLDMSRNTLREAFRTLEAEGLIHNRPQRSPVVTILSKEQAQELYELREVLEGTAIRLFALRADDKMVTDLENAARGLASAIESGEVRQILQTKEHFLHVMLDGAKNSALRVDAMKAYSRLASLRMKSLSSPGRANVSASEVLASSAAVRKRQADEAELLWRQHVKNAAVAALAVSFP